MFLFFMLSAGSGEGFPWFTCFNFVPVCGPGTGTDSSSSVLVLDVSFVSSFSILSFVFAIASAPSDFLYLNNEYII